MSEFKCIDCKVSTLKKREYYMVRNDIWSTANPKLKGMLCIGCLEKRLDRKLNHEDFMWAPINIDAVLFGSKRLRDRLDAEHFMLVLKEAFDLIEEEIAENSKS